MKAAFLTSSLIASKGKAAPASPRLAPKNLLDEGKKDSENHVSRIYDRVREYAEPAPTESEEHAPDVTAQAAPAPHVEKSAEDIPAVDTTTSKIDRQDRAFMTRETRSDDSDERTETVFNGTPSNEQRGVAPASSQSSYASASSSTPSITSPSQARTTTPLGEEQAKKIAAEVSKLKKDGLGRIRISVRMSPQDHLQLKLIAAHTQMSAQSIFETALEEYVANHGTEILPQTCHCVLDKSSL
jgi:hypothetical protein